MKKNESKKTYMFYVSDYHFEMIGLLNIKKELKAGKKVIVFTQNDLRKTVKEVISKITMKEEEKEKLKNINWKNEDNVKYKEISEALDKNQEISVYIKGNEKYIKEQNEKINKMLKNKKEISITDCYDFSEISDRGDEIIKKYDEALVTNKKIKVKN